MKKNPWLMLFVLLFVFVSIFAFVLGSSMISMFGGEEASIRITSKNSILHMKLDGIILDGTKFVKALKKYREEKDIKAIVIEVNSPGGVVGPSQEIYEEIKRTRQVHNKPVVISSIGLNASGAYYASVAADKIIVAQGTMIGSIGVIMEFANLQGLYDWAKINRYSITTGKFKDSGAEYRPMREDEKALFQEMINEVWVQFKDAVAEGRNLKPEVVDTYADGRVMTGASAVKLGFADKVGTLEDAFVEAAKLAGLGDDYEVFELPKKRPGILEMLSGQEEDPYSKTADKILGKLLRTELANKPLYLMPGSY